MSVTICLYLSWVLSGEANDRHNRSLNILTLGHHLSIWPTSAPMSTNGVTFQDLAVW
jgi:hypothetical protein